MTTIGKSEARFTAGPSPLLIGKLGLDDVHRHQSSAHTVQVCGWSTGHVVRDVAFCDTAERARLFSAAADMLRAILMSDREHWTPAMRAAISKALGTDQA